MPNFETYQTVDLAPGWLQDQWGRAFLGALGARKDAHVALLKEAAKCGMPSLCPVDALALLGAERGIDRGPAETEASYRGRVRAAWDTWRWAGTPFGLLAAFYWAGYRPTSGKVVLQTQGDAVAGGKQYALRDDFDPVLHDPSLPPAIRTNLLLRSQEFNDAAWGKANVSTTPDSTAAPDGSTTAETLTKTANAFASAYQTSIVVDQGQTYTVSAYVKAGTLGSASLRIISGANDASRVVDLAGGAIIPGGSNSGFVAATATSVGSGWWRITMSVTAAAATMAVYLYPGDLRDAVAGSIYGWGAQLETGSSATAYIPTAGTTAWVDDISPLVITDLGVVHLGGAPAELWQDFAVLFVNPLPPAWIPTPPADGSIEVDGIRSLITRWKPGHERCVKLAVAGGRLLGYPVDDTFNTYAGQTIAQVGGSGIAATWTPPAG
jgi:hypothetical protein